MKLPTILKKKAEIGKEYIIINNGDSAFKTSLFDVTGDADTSKVEPFFPKNEGEVKVEHKTAQIGKYLGIACEDKGWLVVDNAYKPIIENPELTLTTSKNLYDDLFHTTLTVSKDGEVVGLIMCVIIRATKEDGEAFDKLNEEKEDDEQRHRLRNKHKSNASKLAWKRNHGNYMKGVREKERKEMNRSFYDICKANEHLLEAQVSRNNVFKDKLAFGFDNIAGGIAVSINKDNGTLSISTSLEQTGNGQYGLTNYDDATLQALFSNIKNSLLDLCQTFDEEISQIMAQNGLKSTK